MKPVELGPSSDDLKCCIAALELRPVVWCQRGPVDLGDRRTDDRRARCRARGAGVLCGVQRYRAADATPWTAADLSLR
jgi:hypothetical protein